MFVSLYLLALVVAAVVLGASFLLGGGGRRDATRDERDDAARFDLVRASRREPRPAAGPGGHLPPRWILRLRSVWFWTFFLEFFGLVGIASEGLAWAPDGPGLALAIGVGGAAGWTAATTMHPPSREKGDPATEAEEP